ncbi:MAG: flagellar motor switch protein FliG [Oligoflexales bacterium]
MKRMTSKEKAAILLTVLGEDIASEILKQLSEQDTRMIIQAMNGLKTIDQDDIDQLLQEFLANLLQPATNIEADPSFMKKVLEKTHLDSKKIADLLPSTPQFRCLDPLSGQEVSLMLSHEHPQTIALVFTQLSPQKLAEAFQHLPQSLQSEVMLRIANLDRIESETLFELEETLEEMLKKSESQRFQKVGGIDKIKSLLQNTTPEMTQQILENLKKTQPDIAEEIENSLFQFSDLIKMDKDSFRVLFQKVDQTTWMIALRGQEQILDIALTVLSTRAAETFQEDFISQKPQKKSDIEKHQQDIITVAKNLAAEGIIRLPTDNEVWV